MRLLLCLAALARTNAGRERTPLTCVVAFGPPPPAQLPAGAQVSISKVRTVTSGVRRLGLEFSTQSSPKVRPPTRVHARMVAELECTSSSAYA